MDQQPLDRRQFNHLVGAAFSGLVAGTTVGCSNEGGTNEGAAGSAGGGSAGTAAGAVAANLHACRGLNECKGQGSDGQNACAGQGTCANVKPHSCGGRNECKNLGGCGSAAGGNACKGQGGCGVPITHAWDAARKNFEKRMQDAGKTFGAAPPAKAKE